MKKICPMALLFFVSSASAIQFDALKKAATDPIAAKMDCTSMSYGVSCRAFLPTYSKDRVRVEWKGKNRHIITISSPTFTLNEIAPKRTSSPREGYQKITSGPFAGYFVKKLGKMLMLRSSAALNGLYDD